MALNVLKGRARTAIVKWAAWAKKTATEALRPFPMVSDLIEAACRSKEELVAENLLLRQQLVVASRKFKQPKFGPHDRSLLVLSASRLRRWSQATSLVKPDTVLPRHAGFDPSSRSSSLM